MIRASPSGVSEGSHIFKRGKYYYLFTAEGGTESGHCEWVCRSEVSPFGPWEVGPANPLWRNGVVDEIQNTGHADLVEDAEGRWWAVFLGVRPVKRGNGWEESVFGTSSTYPTYLLQLIDNMNANSRAGRESFLVPMEWTAEGWPVINSGEKITLQNSTPSLLYQYNPPVAWKDTFTTPKLQIGWYRKNTPLKKDYTYLPENGILRLHGSPYTLSTPACPTMFLRKQTHRFCVWETRLAFEPNSTNTEAGTVVYLNYFTYASIGVRLASEIAEGGNKGKRIIRFTPSNLGPTHEAIDIPLSSSTSDVILRVECGDEYRFGFREVEAGTSNSGDDGGEVQWIQEVGNKSLVEAPLPVGAPFTGIMLGLYSFGDREAVLVPADFRYAEFKDRQ
jgi:beta-xylosidase